jgi:hypothetical protein
MSKYRMCYVVYTLPTYSSIHTEMYCVYSEVTTHLTAPVAANLPTTLFCTINLRKYPHQQTQPQITKLMG